MSFQISNKRPYLIARCVPMAVILTVLILVFFLLSDDLIARMDFTSYYTAASIIKNKMGGGLYDVSTQLSFQNRYFNTSLGAVPFKNLPLLAILFIPLSYLPLVVSYKILVLLNIISLVVSAKLLATCFVGFDERLSQPLVFLFFPALMAIILGQISILILILWILIFQALKNKKALLLGILTAFLVNKLQYLVFCPFVLILAKDKKKFLSGFFLTITAVIIVSVAIVGEQGLISYPQFLTETESARYGSEVFSQIGIPSAIYNFIHFFGLRQLGVASVYFISFSVMLAPFVLFAKNYSKLSLESNFSIATFLTLAFLPHGWEYALVVLLVPVFCLLSAIHKTRDKQVNRKRILLILLLFSLWTFRFWAAPFWVGIILAVLGTVLAAREDRMSFFTKY